MIYLSLDKDYLRMISITKPVVGNFTLSHFQKRYENDLFADFGQKDPIGSAISEALTSVSAEGNIGNSLTLILPNSFFQFLRFEIPSDIAERVVGTFLKDKLKQEYHIVSEEHVYDFTTQSIDGKTVATCYVLSKKTLSQITAITSLLSLNLEQVLPDTISYFTLFSKTLREDKVENIFYANYDKTNSFLYEYDSFGLLGENRILLSGDAIAKMKEAVASSESDGRKVHRVILSGVLSKQVRQDLFTKEIGAWTNPLERIILNFYHTYVKSISGENSENFSLLEFDVCLGAFIFASENKNFSLLKGASASEGANFGANSSRIFGSSTGSSTKMFALNKKFVLILLASILITMGVVIFAKNGSSSLMALIPMKSTPSPEPSPTDTPTPTPTPKIDKDALKVKVLNGGGVKGKANVVKSALKDKGYGDIVTGNASSFDIEKSFIEVAKGNTAVAQMIQKDLSELVEGAAIKELETSPSADIIFTIGQDLK